MTAPRCTCGLAAGDPCPNGCVGRLTNGESFPCLLAGKLDADGNLIVGSPLYCSACKWVFIHHDAAALPAPEAGEEWPPDACVGELVRNLDALRDTTDGTMISAIRTYRQWLASLPPRPLKSPSDAACRKLVAKVLDAIWLKPPAEILDKYGQQADAAIRATFERWARGEE